MKDESESQSTGSGTTTAVNHDWRYLRKTGDAAEAKADRKFVEMIQEVRTEFYGDADSDEWPVPEMTIVIDGGPEFARQGFRDVELVGIKPTPH